MNTERIADLSDLATAHEEMFTAAAISARKPEGPLPCGECLNCEAPLPAGQRWCDTDCREDWARLTAIHCPTCGD